MSIRLVLLSHILLGAVVYTRTFPQSFLEMMEPDIEDIQCNNIAKVKFLCNVNYSFY